MATAGNCVLKARIGHAGAWIRAQPGLVSVSFRPVWGAAGADSPPMQVWPQGGADALYGVTWIVTVALIVRLAPPQPWPSMNVATAVIFQSPAGRRMSGPVRNARLNSTSGCSG